MTPCTDYFFIAIVLISVTNLPYLSIEIEWYNMMKILGCGCNSVGKAVASNSRGPQFESSHQKTFILNIYCQLYWKDENKVKEVGHGPFFKKINCISSLDLNLF